jgi:hypothetical protein
MITQKENQHNWIMTVLFLSYLGEKTSTSRNVKDVAQRVGETNLCPSSNKVE